ncbi:Putative cytochrome C oxidase assembly protein [Plasmopara halstedii]|uniref:Putative cytochrome C oxidase assembly protein n=1 Tax=Plasmopara halstedii TaxID=4781 RepID=A0A0P1A9M5_PLAHL|nr:Putative cytochrome C oxidase assembly protein [Plasmopara halstedii]CEG37426.1 Putative cytochrome C oxidase assembly protein [Plasmopara halstedii]|eukprot:XP_024573795.1 Putative cytochrome C oxidase assembly protein [Plasmopara halstedii]
MASQMMKFMKMVRSRQTAGLQATYRRFSDAPVPRRRTEKFGPITWSGLALAGVVGSGAVYYYFSEKDRLQTQTTSKVTSVGKPLLGGPWTLVDCDTRRAVTDASFRGKYTLLYFGFTHCPDICPNELVRIGNVLDKLETDKTLPEVVPLFVTVDPKRDTIAQMQLYKADFHPKMKMLTDHSIVMYLVGPDGDFLDFFTQNARVDDIVAKIKSYF